MPMPRILAGYISLTDRSITLWLISPIKSVKRVLYHELMIAVNNDNNNNNNNNNNNSSNLIIHFPYGSFQIMKQMEHNMFKK